MSKEEARRAHAPARAYNISRVGDAWSETCAATRLRESPAPCGLAGQPRTEAGPSQAAAQPASGAAAFFEKLAELGDDGPLEVPVDQTRGALWIGAPRIMLSLYHRRRTSACFGSYPPPGREALAVLASRLPEPEAIDSLSQMGFTTVIFRHRNERLASLRMLGRVGRAAEQGHGIEHIYSTPTHTAFSLRPGTSP